MRLALIRSTPGETHGQARSDSPCGLAGRVHVDPDNGPCAGPGNIVPCAEGKSDSHLHIMAAKSSGDVIGGHLFDCEVFATCEIVLVEILIDGVERHFSESGGTPTLFFDREA